MVNIKFDSKDKLIMLIIRYKKVKITVGDEGLIVEPDKIERRKNPRAFPISYNNIILEEVVRSGAAYVEYLNGKYILWRDSGIITLILNDIVYKGLNNYGTPQLLIDGELCSGYGKIWNKLFGEEWGNYDKELLVKSIKCYTGGEVDPKPVLSEFKLLKEGQKYKKKYPVISYGGDVIHGEAGLKTRFPGLTSGELKNIYIQVGWTSNKKEIENRVSKADSIIDKFGLVLLDDEVSYGLNWGKIRIRFKLKKDLVDYIKKQGETISKDTAAKMFVRLKIMREEILKNIRERSRV